MRRESSDTWWPITITGKHFVAMPTVSLGTISVSDVQVLDSTTITGKIPRNAPPYTYPVKVTNPDCRSCTLPGAFTVYDSDEPTVRLESPSLITFGSDAAPPYNEPSYQAQLVFFEIPSGTLSLSETLYVRIFDADTGEGMSDRIIGSADTTISYTLYGLTGTYSLPTIPPSGPPIGDIHSGTPLLTAAIGVSSTLDQKWYSLGPFSAGQGEQVAGRYLFRLTVEGGSGDDGNIYKVALSTLTDTNRTPAEVRMFAFSWALDVTEAEPPYLYPFVREDMTVFRQRNFGCQCHDGILQFQTPLTRTLEARWSEVDGQHMPEKFEVQPGEEGATWLFDLRKYLVPPGYFDYLGFWAEDEQGLPLHIFTRPTEKTPPDL
jgi:hypothetical protein